MTKASRLELFLYASAGVLALAGLAEATYLTVAFFAGETLVCGGSSACSEVLGSRYAHLGKIPVAAFGALAYFAVFSFATFAAFRYRQARRLLLITVTGMFAGTLWLLFVQAFLLHAFCRYCLFSAALIFILTGTVVLLPKPE